MKNKKSINVHIPIQLYIKLLENKRIKGQSLTFQIITALEKYFNS